MTRESENMANIENAKGDKGIVAPWFDTSHLDAEQNSSDSIMKSQMEELDNAIEECIQRFRDETTGTGTRVLIAEFEELMFLRTKLLTRMVIADQQVKHICMRYKHQPKPKVRFPRFQPLNISDTEKSANVENTISKCIDCAYRKADRNSKIALGITVATITLIILAYLDKIVSFVCYVLFYQR